MSFNLATTLRESRRKNPDKPLCHLADRTFSYAQVDEISGRVATSLRNLGLTPGEAVAVQLPNIPQFLFVYYAILKAGLTMVPLNPLLKAPEVEYHLADSEARLPTMYIALLQADTAGRDLSSLRRCVSGGASIPGEVIRGFEQKFPGTVILEGYGLSETASTATFNIDADRRKVLSIGRPIWGVEARIVDEDGTSLSSGPEHVGEIVLRGHNVMKGYHGKPEATAEAMRGGWFHTGDLGYADEDGYLFIVDRTKDLIIRAGFNVYPREVEEVLYAHPAVAEAAVIGRPDQRVGEEVTAGVGLKPGASATPEELIAYCKERVAAYKYPREVRLVAELPKGPTGKILKKELREL